MYRTRDPRSDLDEFVCPRCRFPVVVPSGELPLRPSCPRDGWPLVSRDAFLRSDGDPLLGAELAGGFVPLEVAGAGSTSTVYRARTREDGVAAIKVLRLDGPLGERVTDAWQREVSALEGLEASGIPRMLDTGRVTQPAAFFIALEWVDGVRLDRASSFGADRNPAQGNERASSDGVARALAIAAAMARALGEVHARGVVHADVNPSNVLVAGDALSIIDFGSSTPEGHARPALDEEGFAGSPAYAAPELLEGGRLDRRADLYSLGCVLYRLLTGAPPFTGTPEAVVRGQLGGEPAAMKAANPEVSSEIEDVVRQLLEKDRARRPASAGAFLTRLGAACRSRI